MIRGQNWLIWNVYKLLTVTNGYFHVVLEHILTDSNKDGSKYIIYGYLNVNFLNYNNCISDVLDYMVQEIL